MKETLKYIGIVLTFMVLIFSYPMAYYNSSEIIEIEVTGKDRISLSKDEHKFVIETPNETFENTDTWLYWKHYSQDYQRDLKIGNTYSVRVAGWRVGPVLSWNRNIVAIIEKQ